MATDDLRIALLEHRADEQDEKIGVILRAATTAEVVARTARDDVERLQDALAERPSSVEFQRFQESVRAKARRSPLPSLSELEFRGPAWLGSFKIQGYSGATLVVALLVGTVAVVAYLVLK